MLNQGKYPSHIPEVVSPVDCLILESLLTSLSTLEFDIVRVLLRLCFLLLPSVIGALLPPPASAAAVYSDSTKAIAVSLGPSL